MLSRRDRKAIVSLGGIGIHILRIREMRRGIENEAILLGASAKWAP